MAAIFAGYLRVLRPYFISLSLFGVGSGGSYLEVFFSRFYEWMIPRPFFSLTSILFILFHFYFGLIGRCLIT